jgi:hypothetical protein
VTEENWPLIEATLMTSQPVDAYGGLQFGKDALELAAASLNFGNVPMQADHDQTKPVRVRNLRAWVDDEAEGFYRLKLSYEIHPDDAHYVATRSGMSAAMRAPLDGREHDFNRDAAVELSADHAWFDDDSLVAAESLLVDGGVAPHEIRTERVYQFSFVPDPQIFVTVALPLAGAIATGSFGSALWDAVKYLYRRRRTPSGGDSHKPTKINIRLESGERSVTGIVETHDEAVVTRALDVFDGLARDFIEAVDAVDDVPDLSDQRLLLWDQGAAAWVPQSRHEVKPPSPPKQ